MGTLGDIRNNFQIALDKVQRLNELDFKDKSEFDEYKSKHDMRDTTEVTIDGKSMKVGDVGKNTNIKNKLEKKVKGIQGEYTRIAFDNEEDAKVFPETFDKLLGGEN